MPSGTVVAEFPVPAERVWEVITDLENAPTWVPDLVSVQRLDSGPMQVGSRFKEVVNIPGRKVEVTVTIDEFDAPRRIAHSGKGGSVNIGGRTTLVETPDGCRLTNEWSVELSGLLKLATPVAGTWTHNNIEASMAALREKLERDEKSA